MFGSILKFTLGIVIGGLVGYVAVSLYTPKSGDLIREDIRKGFDDIRLDFESGSQQKKEDLEAEIRRRCGE